MSLQPQCALRAYPVCRGLAEFGDSVVQPYRHHYQPHSANGVGSRLLQPFETARSVYCLRTRLSALLPVFRIFAFRAPDACV